MTIPRLEELYRHWRQFPPLEVTVLAISEAVGVKFNTETSASSAQGGQDLQGLVELFGGIGSEKPEWLKTM